MHADEIPGPAAPVSNAFRAGLRRELPRWRADGLVDERVERALVARYRLEQKSADVTTTAIYLLGALLIGGGVISFVAWNWEHIPDAVKLALGGSAMLAADVLGYRWWKVTRTRPRIGHAIVCLGTLLYGANIALVAQVFNIHSNWYGGLGAWAIGATIAAWALTSLPNAALAVVLALLWSIGFVDDHHAWSPLGPWLLASVFLPLALRTRSRILFALVAVATVASLGIGAGMEAQRGAAAVAAFLAGCAALLAWPFAFRDGSVAAGLSTVAGALGLLGFGAIAYIASFHELAHQFAFARVDATHARWAFAAVPVLLLAAAFVAVGWRRAADVAAWARASAVHLTALAGTGLLLAAMAAPAASSPLTVAGNVALVATAAVAVAASVRDLERGPFWLSTLTLAGVVVTRFFEFDTNLGVKAAVFVGSGIAVICVGIAFERRLRAHGGGDAVD
jgi:uncharacterized membrane protein